MTPKLEKLREEVVQRVRIRLNATEYFSKKGLDSLWGACLFEATALDILGGACSFFTKEDAEILEYANDVEDYWEKSHGQSLNHEISCVLMNEVLLSLDSRRVKFLFGHAETIMPMAAFLGFFKDPQHIGQNYQSELSRKWRSGHVSPFAANIAFALKTCPIGGDLMKFVEIRHNERLMDISHLCENQTGRKYMCPLEEFKRSLEERIGSCNFHEICKLKETRNTEL